ncbi:Asp/Glu/hydantoin racemase [Erysipelothrix sp. HDW6A]|uniref:Asp/Glu/hydantoin racemase n=1 Tax=Erysipelothrix sp. HDW6A TaxID=2714928 RepID=UPI001407ED1A|nr:Asp/Glu/hydantoin racemase [Erysipelothrix sp. HDW6A]QIK56893.1 Asp/Glu/hydantoin racemase [Erysipelothrix sp. HDW6A]
MKVTMIHTSQVSVNDLMNLCNEIIPGVEITNIIDDSLLKEVKENNGITEAIINRMTSYVKIAVENGADIVFNQCSSVGEAFDIAIKNVDVKTLKVDKPMAEKAVNLGSKIAVIATVSSTMYPSANLIKTTAKEMGKEIEVEEFYIDGALDILMKEKDVEKHNELVLRTIEKAQKTNDVVVLAQGSMYVLHEQLNQFKKPVLVSPRLAIERLSEMLGDLHE